MLTLDTIMKDTLWVARHSTGYRFVGNYDEVEAHVKSCDNDEWDYIKDMDILCEEGQPEHLREFYKKYLDQDEYYYIDEYYNNVYSKEMVA